MFINLNLDPDSPLYISASSNAFDAGQHLGEIIMLTKQTEHSMDNTVFAKSLVQEGFQFYKSGRKAYKEYDKTVKLIKAFNDVGLHRFYTKMQGGTKKLILKGYMSQRKITKGPIRNLVNVPTHLKNVDFKTWKAAGKGKSWVTDGVIEVIEWGGDIAVAHIEGNSLTWEEHIRHGADVAGTAVAGTATLATAAILTGIAASGVGVPVIAMFVIPYVVGSAFKKGYSNYVDDQLEEANQNSTSYAPEHISLPKPVLKHKSHCHSKPIGAIRPPLLTTDSFTGNIHEQVMYNELLEWIRKAQPTTVNQKEFNKKINLY